MKASSKEHLKELIQRYPDLAACEADLEQAAETMIDCYRQGGKVMVCGNGGSAADSLHIVGELMKGFILPRKLKPELQEKLRSTCPEMAEYCIANLQGALPAISLVNDVAKALGIKVIGLAGQTGGKMVPWCDVCIKVPSKVTFKIQEYHLPVYHALCLCLEEEFFGQE